MYWNNYHVYVCNVLEWWCFGMSLLCCCQSTPLHIHRMHKGTYMYVFQSTGSWAPSGAHCSLKLCVCVRHVAHSWSTEWPTYLLLRGSRRSPVSGSGWQVSWECHPTQHGELCELLISGKIYRGERSCLRCLVCTFQTGHWLSHTHTQQVYMEIGVMHLKQNTPPQKCSDVAHTDETEPFTDCTLGWIWCTVNCQLFLTGDSIWITIQQLCSSAGATHSPRHSAPPTQPGCCRGPRRESGDTADGPLFQQSVLKHKIQPVQHEINHLTTYVRM